MLARVPALSDICPQLRSSGTPGREKGDPRPRLTEIAGLPSPWRSAAPIVAIALRTATGAERLPWRLQTAAILRRRSSRGKLHWEHSSSATHPGARALALLRQGRDLLRMLRPPPFFRSIVTARKNLKSKT